MQTAIESSRTAQCQTSRAWLVRSAIAGATIGALISAGSAFADFEYKGNVSLLGQAFTEDAIHSGDKTANFSGSAEIELYKAFGDGNKSIVFTPFVRAHFDGDSQSHADIRELLYVDSSEVWEFSLGVGQVFWGVAESRNVVDIINQVDQLEGISTDSKLGQPMINLTSVRDWGTLAFYVLPGFRELEYPDDDSRPRLPITIDQDAARFESDDEASHIDYALRYSHFIDEWDFGLSYFTGTSRTPLLRPSSPSGIPEQKFAPFYYQINQIGLDVQATLESWLLKLELIRQSGSAIENHYEAVTGFEYSFYGIFETNMDIGLVSEYLWDERNEPTHIFQNDLLIGLRFALNDEQSSEALLGVVTDLDYDSYLLTLEGSRRIGNSVKLSAEATIWGSDDERDPLFNVRKEDYLQLEFSYFF